MVSKTRKRFRLWVLLAVVGVPVLALLSPRLVLWLMFRADVAALRSQDTTVVLTYEPGDGPTTKVTRMERAIPRLQEDWPPRYGAAMLAVARDRGEPVALRATLLSLASEPIYSPVIPGEDTDEPFLAKAFWAMTGLRISPRSCWNSNRAIPTLRTILLDQGEPRELRGVAAHELAGFTAYLDTQPFTASELQALRGIVASASADQLADLNDVASRVKALLTYLKANDDTAGRGAVRPLGSEAGPIEK